MRKNPTYTHLFGTIRLLIFSKKSHLCVYSVLYFYSDPLSIRNFRVSTRLFGLYGYSGPQSNYQSTTLKYPIIMQTKETYMYYVVKTYVYIPGRHHNSHLHHYRVHSLFLDIGPYSPVMSHIFLFLFHSCSSLVRCQLYCIHMLNFTQDQMNFRRIICMQQLCEL